MLILCMVVCSSRFRLPVLQAELDPTHYMYFSSSSFMMIVPLGDSSLKINPWVYNEIEYFSYPWPVIYKNTLPVYTWSKVGSSLLVNGI